MAYKAFVIESRWKKPPPGLPILGEWSVWKRYTTLRQAQQAVVYKIINPSDPYTMESDDLLAASLACMLLGEGKYALSDPSGETACPFFIMGREPDLWLKEKFGVSLDEAMKNKRVVIAQALESVLIGNDVDRELLKSATQEAREKYTDRRRTSMNDIGTRAAILAKRLRELADAE